MVPFWIVRRRRYDAASLASAKGARGNPDYCLELHSNKSNKEDVSGLTEVRHR